MKIAIVDDEIECRDEIYECIKAYDVDELFTIEKFSSAMEILSATDSYYDIVFLDIEMPEMDGIKLAEELFDRNSNSVFIYVSSHVSYVSKAIRSHGFQFLVKPIDKSEFKIEIDRAREEVHRKDVKIEIKTNREIKYVPASEITYIESYGRGTIVHLKSGDKISNNSKYSILSDKLIKYSFRQIHRCYTVNLMYVVGVNKDNVNLKSCQDYVPISRNMRDKFLVELNKYLRGKIK